MERVKKIACALASCALGLTLTAGAAFAVSTEIGVKASGAAVVADSEAFVFAKEVMKFQNITAGVTGDNIFTLGNVKSIVFMSNTSIGAGTDKIISFKLTNGVFPDDPEKKWYLVGPANITLATPTGAVAAGDFVGITDAGRNTVLVKSPAAILADAGIYTKATFDNVVYAEEDAGAGSDTLRMFVRKAMESTGVFYLVQLDIDDVATIDIIYDPDADLPNENAAYTDTAGNDVVVYNDLTYMLGKLASYNMTFDIANFELDFAYDAATNVVNVAAIQDVDGETWDGDDIMIQCLGIGTALNETFYAAASEQKTLMKSEAQFAAVGISEVTDTINVEQQRKQFVDEGLGEAVDKFGLAFRLVNNAVIGTGAGTQIVGLNYDTASTQTFKHFYDAVANAQFNGLALVFKGDFSKWDGADGVLQVADFTSLMLNGVNVAGIATIDADNHVVLTSATELNWATALGGANYKILDIADDAATDGEQTVDALDELTFQPATADVTDANAEIMIPQVFTMDAIIDFASADVYDYTDATGHRGLLASDLQVGQHDLNGAQFVVEYMNQSSTYDTFVSITNDQTQIATVDVEMVEHSSGTPHEKALLSYATIPPKGTILIWASALRTAANAAGGQIDSAGFYAKFTVTAPQDSVFVTAVQKAGSTQRVLPVYQTGGGTWDMGR